MATRNPYRSAENVTECPKCGTELAWNNEDGLAGQSCLCGHVFTDADRDRSWCGYCGQEVKRSAAGYWTLDGGDGRAALTCDESDDNRHDPDGSTDD